MSTEQDGRVVLVGGATGGLGPAVVQAFAAEGARLVLSSRRQEELEKTAAALSLPAEKTLLLPANATSLDEVSAMVQTIEERFGGLDVVVQVTGGFQMKPATDMTVKDWRFLMDLNLDAAFFTARAVLPGMLSRGTGKLIFVSSRSGSQPGANASGYAASKSGLEALVRVLAEETRQHGVNVNAIAPSLIDTPPNRQAMPNAAFEKWVTPESLAGVITFLASEVARDVHGAIIPVYGRS